ncbi:MAG: ABC transporter ATP-binding protein/permease [Bacillales bacterium]|nr:ABC transporter ATP-binding protein/permease [Bacillales bacterium]
MLELVNIAKDYVSQDNVVHALKDVSVTFREAEFVSILGPSGCGKTTLLNIIGGLDGYTNGELIIDNISTKNYKDRDWDNYRNHRIGFVFQNYNLIPHQTVLRNVELALTLAGIKRKQRREIAINALEKVGLKDQIKKKPNQLSGGQMQRVAIARALVNNPDIILADEPTGALDSETSIQVMELLKEVSKERLVIMVTHNPELAQIYSTRIIRLADGHVFLDSNPIKKEEIEKCDDETRMIEVSSITKSNKKMKKPKMSVFTAFVLSMKNMWGKKTRTLLTSIAGSIGIIGIALILSMSDGFQNYINKVQEDTLSTYPITITKNNTDYSSVIELILGETTNTEVPNGEDIYSVEVLSKLMENLSSSTQSNNLNAFKDYLDSKNVNLSDKITGVQYSYGLKMNLYNDYKVQVNPSSFLNDLLASYVRQYFNNPNMDISKYSSQFSAGISTISKGLFTEMLDNRDLLESQFDVVAGEWPWENKIYSEYKEYQKMVLVVNKDYSAPDFRLYQLGLIDGEYQQIVDDVAKYTLGKIEEPPMSKLNAKEILGRNYKVLLQSDYFTKGEEGLYRQLNDAEIQTLLDNKDAGINVIISGVIKEKPNAAATSITQGSLAYSKRLSEYYIEQSNNSQIVKDQLKDTTVNIFTGRKYEEEVIVFSRNDLVSYMDDLVIKSAGYVSDEITYGEYIVSGLEKTIKENRDKFNELITQKKEYETLVNTLVNSMYEGKTVTELTDDEFASFCLYLMMNFERPEIGIYHNALMSFHQSYSYSSTKKAIGIFDEDSLESISIYCSSFASKDEISNLVDYYNNNVAENETDRITYTDYVGLMMKSISIIIQVISYVLIGFVSVSLIVSSIMIGIITYISVIERTKEIGVLRSLGASKGDIANLFNAETIILGLLSGTIGVCITLILNLPINAIINKYASIGSIAELPLYGALGLIGISVILTFISGLIPSQVASKKDPVIALRSE